VSCWIDNDDVRFLVDQHS